jgi:CRISPR-associated exonuclease Cas4
MTITGTIINYYFHCKRQCWLFSNRINLEDNSEDVRIGRVLHEIEHEKSKNTEISIDNVKLDKITDEYLVEIKKSDADIVAVEWQVLLYLKKLKDKGIEKRGKIEFIEKNKQDHKVQYIDLNEKNEQQLIELENEITNFITTPIPPKATLLPKCQKCAYYEYCFL